VESLRLYFLQTAGKSNCLESTYRQCIVCVIFRLCLDHSNTLLSEPVWRSAESIEAAHIGLYIWAASGGEALFRVERESLLCLEPSSFLDICLDFWTILVFGFLQTETDAELAA
jgi:hypothetical protein